MIADRGCAERGCACYDSRIDCGGVEMVKREWVGLTDEEIFETHKQVDSMQYLTFGKAIEAKLKEKNT
jgi:hypothetical protein